MAGVDPASWVPPSVDMGQPNAARMYDYFLGGAHNFEADRAAALAVLAVAPHVRDAAYANRAFLRRTVRYALDHGIRQFLDLGSGLPSAGNVHETVHATDSAAHVLYVDSDPVVIAHATRLLADTETAAAIEADLRDTTMILGHEQTRRLIDFHRPVAVLLVSVLHFVPGTADDLAGLIADLIQRTQPGSLMVISHATPYTSNEQTNAVQDLYATTSTPLHLRTPAEIRRLFSGLDLIPADPHSSAAGELVPVTRWRPDPGEEQRPDELAASPFIAGFLAGVARKPDPTGTPTPEQAAAPTVHTAGGERRPRNDPRFSPTPSTRRTVSAARP
jgi:O-methyltransferase involved in polyketide biosynthesis